LPEYGVPFTSVFEQTYTIELYVPSAPSGAQNEPGRTFTNVDVDAAVVAVTEPTVVTVADRVPVLVATVVGALATVVGTVATDVEVVEVVATGAAVVAGEPTATGGALQPRIVVPAHCPDNKLLTLPHSLSSIERFHRAFTETQLARYVHQ
jgi:hypothetical protein